MDKQFQVGDIVVWDETGRNYNPRLIERLGTGPFVITTLHGPHGHIYIKSLPGTKIGTDKVCHGSGPGISCGDYDIRPNPFLTAVYRATHEKI